MVNWMPLWTFEIKAPDIMKRDRDDQKYYLVKFRTILPRQQLPIVERYEALFSDRASQQIENPDPIGSAVATAKPQ